MEHFCTLFDSNYLAKGLALVASMRRHFGPFRLHVLCLDRATWDYFAARPDPAIRPILLEELERGDDALRAAKGNRSKVEYYFTLTPSLPLYVFRDPSIARVSYVDADLYFYRDAAPIFEELGSGSVAIIGHRFPDHLRDREQNGLYNVGYLAFRNDGQGDACLRWWRDRCNEWCYDLIEPDRFADQKYLDRFPLLFPGVRVLEQKGAGLSPWNLLRYRVSRRRGEVFVDGDPLVFYHFHNFSLLSGRWVEPGLRFYWDRSMSSEARRFLFDPYVRELRRIQAENPGAVHVISRHEAGPGGRTPLDFLREGPKLFYWAGRSWRLNGGKWVREGEALKKARNIARKVGRDLRGLLGLKKKAPSP